MPPEARAYGLATGADAYLEDAEIDGVAVAVYGWDAAKYGDRYDRVHRVEEK